MENKEFYTVKETGKIHEHSKVLVDNLLFERCEDWLPRKIFRRGTMDGISYINLCNAIVRQAVVDYKAALKKNDEWQIIELERFFRGWWFATICNLDGEAVMEAVRKRVGERYGK